MDQPCCTYFSSARLSLSKPSLNIVHISQLYSHFFASVWNDITDGSNPGCGTNGFPTAPGWDPVTGLGTPKFPRLLSRFMALP